MQSLNLTDGRLFCPSCGKRECDMGETDCGATEWECPHCHTPFTVPAGTHLAQSTAQQAARCKDGCTYSRSMSQPYPRHCVKCGQIELITKAAVEPFKDVFKGITNPLSSFEYFPFSGQEVEGFERYVAADGQYHLRLPLPAGWVGVPPSLAAIGDYVFRNKHGLIFGVTKEAFYALCNNS